ncbi:MAG: arsenic efflux protein [Clostridia bacterium]|nr:arsenic efflux protein [Clostridia bacterium]
MVNITEHLSSFALHAHGGEGTGEAILEIILHSLWETLSIALFMFLTYLLMEFLEHRSSGATARLIGRAGRFGPILGGLFGAVPQCGFSAAASGLYAGRIVTRGTLIAVFLSTSDEMLPIMLSGIATGSTNIIQLLSVIGIKIICGMLVGFAVDLLIPAHRDRDEIMDLCEQEGCNCGRDGIWRSALKHTLKVAFFVLVATLALNTAMHFIGEDRIAYCLRGLPVVGELIAALIGLIPNCAASVVITELYLGGAIGAGQLLAGLFTGAGVGLLVLFRANRRLGDNLITLAILFASGAGLGMIFEYTGLAALLGL